MIVKTTQPALPQPERSRRRKMSANTVKSSQNHSTHRKKMHMVQNTSRNG